ncbi:MAG: carboxypeptidase regulatory-like domain-containing protein [Agriterribacter sp.]
MMQKLWLLAFLTGFLFHVNAQNTTKQYTLTGLLRDSATHKPVAYATVSIYDSLKNNIASSFSLENGSFKMIIPGTGTYNIEISFVGYRTKELSIDIITSQLIFKLDDIMLAPGNDYLQEVKVTSRKRLVDQKPGMLVYNAENDATNKGGTAADVLRKAPVLNVDAQGNVSMRGSSNLKILINGKYSGQMAGAPLMH